MRRIGLNFLWHALRPAAVALVAVAGLGCLLLAAQVLVRAPVVPGPAGVARVVVGMLPVALSTALPAAVLAGGVAAARSWALGGEWRALAVMGLGARRLAPALVLAGGVAGASQAALTHHLDPAGRRHARAALLSAATDLGLRAGEPLVLPEGVLRAREVRGAEWTGVFFAQGELVLSARHGRVRAGRLELEQGTAWDLESGWRASFEAADIPLRLPGRRFELSERSLASLRGLLERKRAAGEPANYETLILYKRSTAALAIPLLLFLGVPLGSRGARPAPAAIGVLVAWWLSIRLFDQAVSVVAPVVAAAAPLLGLAAVTLLLWLRWRDR